MTKTQQASRKNTGVGIDKNRSQSWTNDTKKNAFYKIMGTSICQWKSERMIRMMYVDF